MRLTVHVTGARKSKDERQTKNGPVAYTRVFSTLAFNNVEPSDVPRILKEIEDDKLGKPFKHYLSNEKIAGRAYK